MLLTVVVSVLVTLYVLFCVGLYAFYYFIEVILDLPVTGQSPCTAHAALKQLIEKLLKEAVNLPLLEKARAHPSVPAEETTNRSYEDLLATAIINKVVAGCQNNLPSSSADSVASSRFSTSSRHKDDREYFFGEETLDSKWKTADLESTSASSLEEWLQCDSSGGSRNYLDKVTLMIKQDIEEVDNFDSDNEQDDAEYFRSSSSLFEESESNWLLQRRKFHGTHSPVPVPMLVPNPLDDAKVLIGDKPIDDTSDLSDVGSDCEEAIQPTTTHTLLVQSKNIIGGGGGGKANVEATDNGDLLSESSTDSGVKEVNGKEQKSFDTAEALKTDISLDDDNVEDSSFLSAYSNTEKEAEYTERFASLPRQILKPCESEPNCKPAEIEPVNADSDENGESYEADSDFEFIGGSYTKKEKEKWRHAVEMKNNPYSKESIESRIKRSNSAAGSIFGPDYYARLASKPSGGGRNAQVNGVAWPSSEPSRSRTPSPPPALPKAAPPSRAQIVTETSPLSDVVETPASFEVPPELPKSRPPLRVTAEVDGIHQALKAIVIPLEEMSQATFHNHVKAEVYRAENSSAVTSDSELSFVNFYDVEHSQIVRKSKNEDIHIPIKATPLGVSYRPIEDGNETVHPGEQLENGYGEDHVARSRVLFGENKGESGSFVKAPPTVKARNFGQERVALRRHLSESSLLDDSFDAPPKVIHPKKDNTLISKIYKDPKVRLFALHSREETPSMEETYNTSSFNSHRSVEAKEIQSETSSIYLSKEILHSSDDGLTSEYDSGKTGRISFFSSEEDLLSLNSDSSHVVDTRNHAMASGEPHFDHYYMASPPATPSTKKFIYGSQEDLLSLEEVTCIRPRKDNTLISKIYQDPNVRNFALKTHKNKLPDSLSSKPKQRESLDHAFSVETRGRTSSHASRAAINSSSSAEISLEMHPEEQNADPSLYAHQVDNVEHEAVDLDVEEIAKRRVVRQALGKFQKSEIEPRQVQMHRNSSVDESNSVRVSVRELKNKFETNDNNNKPVVSSLTARSLSTQVKAALKR
ncbi:uncharacterized protein LOC109535752 isoform X4 [Dendroctonus ponderosae]|uniref:uncharacterized protein LOC109535752 isoform X4 n=1 Tax=Dendroctonus ponderosae TaxID=77166 RepID=UPI002035CE8D|nr:uncharacterized protein LOC109535752 isoform X4 [Dendroctonus ponderosae]XP_019757285.2 uncharacterized protein LOC109535752 isoform X4 [Dendroctonus ponderosae]XP_019757286.2 uncharacterized protein LOC109535752 isoform X4 [Dendroctonus ponderosae]XP_019757288.2 uncharacterized protein LOC109535752 isoform X4 [Dendroctonus ponderosae]XP_048520494.1 uncharacterized protein LOC109535752 isoform X4 [Dendroctonus ponderosae]